MARLSNWESAFADFLAERRFMPFEYGRHDCALFGADCALALTGTDPAPDFRGKYRTLAGSIRALRNIGEGDLESTFDARFSVKPAAFARRGDLVFNGEAIGVCIGAEAVFVGEENGAPGLVKFPMSAMSKAWTI
jgi:hypothetical protein